jgi:hypothetical protein
MPNAILVGGEDKKTEAYTTGRQSGTWNQRRATRLRRRGSSVVLLLHSHNAYFLDSDAYSAYILTLHSGSSWERAFVLFFRAEVFCS